MQVEVCNVFLTDNGNIRTLGLMCGNENTTASPRQVFRAMKRGEMQSQTAILTKNGLAILFQGDIINIKMKLTRDERTWLSNSNLPSVSNDANFIREADDKEIEECYNNEQKNIYAKQCEEDRLKRKAVADRIKAEGPKNLTDDDRRRLRLEAVRKGSKSF